MPVQTKKRNARRAGAPRVARPGRAGEAALIVAALESFTAGRADARMDPAAIHDPLLRRIAKAAAEAIHRGEARAQESEERLQSLTRGVDQSVQGMVRLVVDGLARVVVQGDLSGDLHLPTEDPALAPLSEGVSQVMETLKRFVSEIRDASLQMSSSAAEVLAAATQNESSTSQQASAIHETTATMEELKGASHQIAENARMVASIAEQTLTATRAGESSIKSFMFSMEAMRKNAHEVDAAISKLSRGTERIGTVVEVIDEIADRSDLLALNAALEGAKAGEAGRGFSIVASEMRRLAENVIASTKEIKNLITEIRESTHTAKQSSDANKRMATEGEKLGQAAMGSVNGILAGAQETSDAARVINLATQQQRTATEQVVQSMSEIEGVTRQAQAGSRQATGAAAELTKLAEHLAELVQRFQER
jgi:methyl-accepting chemotaxis protein